METVDGHGYTIHNIPKSLREKVMKLYTQGNSLKGIVDKLKISKTALCTILYKKRPRPVVRARAGRRKDISFERKIKVLGMYNDGKSQREIGESLNIGQSCVCRILKRQSKIIDASISTIGSSVSRRKFRCLIDAEEALATYFSIASLYNIPLTVFKIDLKAREFARYTGYDSFPAQPYWLSRWLWRNCILTSDEKQDDVIPDHPDISNYKQEDIYALKDVGLRTRLSQSDELERISVLFCCNSTGTDRRRLMAIGDELLPGVDNPPCDYDIGYFKSRLTTELFVEWVLTLDRDMRILDRNILLVLDSSPVHPSEVTKDLTNIELLFLNPDVENPFDVGIIKHVLHSYRHELSIKVKLSHDKLDILDILHILNKSWLGVCSSTIEDSFLNANLIHVQTTEPQQLTLKHRKDLNECHTHSTATPPCCAALKSCEPHSRVPCLCKCAEGSEVLAAFCSSYAMPPDKEISKIIALNHEEDAQLDMELEDTLDLSERFPQTVSGQRVNACLAKLKEFLTTLRVDMNALTTVEQLIC